MGERDRFSFSLYRLFEAKCLLHSTLQPGSVQSKFTNAQGSLGHSSVGVEDGVHFMQGSPPGVADKTGENVDDGHMVLASNAPVVHS